MLQVKAPSGAVMENGRDVPTAVVIHHDRLLLDLLAGLRAWPLRFIAGTSEVKQGLASIALSPPTVTLVGARSFREGIERFTQSPVILQRQTRLALWADDLSDLELERAAELGVFGLLSQRDSLTDLEESLHAICHGERRLSPKLATRVVLTQPGNRFQVCLGGRVPRLTSRQVRVLLKLVEGRRVKEIAEELGSTEKAIESQKYRLMARLGIHDRLDLCRWAIREGLIQP